MFDLFRSREKNVRWLLGILLGLVALSMVVTLVPSYGGLGRGRVDQTIVAEIGDEVVTTAQVRQMLMQASRAGILPRGLEAVYAPRLLRQLISERATAYAATRLGMTVSPEQLATEIQGQMPQLFEGGKFAGTAAYAAYLQQINKTIPEYEADMRDFILAQRLERAVLEGIVVSPVQVEEEFRRRNEKIRVASFKLSPDKFRQQVTVTPEEMQAYYKSNAAAFNIPETRDVLYFVLDEAKLAAAAEVPEADLRRAYDEQRESFRNPERVHVVHILLKTAGKSDSETKALRKRMDDLLKQLRGGANFADLASKNSEDTASATKGGDIGWITRGQTVPEFEQAAFSLKPGQISDVITTTYGFHIVRVEAKEAAHLRSFEEVRNELQQQLGRQRVADKLQSLADQIHAALGRSSAEAESLAAANGIKALRASQVRAGSPVPEIGRNPAFDDAVDSLPKGGVSPLVSLSPTQLLVAQVVNVNPPHPADFALVEARIHQTLVNEKASRAMNDKAQAVAQQLKGGQDFNAVAKSLGAEVKTTSTPFGRDGAAEGIGAAGQIESAFSKQVGEFAGPFFMADGTYLVKVVEKIQPDMSQLPAQRAQMLAVIKSKVAEDRRELFVEGLVDAMTKAKIVKVHEDNIKRLLSTYGG